MGFYLTTSFDCIDVNSRTTIIVGQLLFLLQACNMRLVKERDTFQPKTFQALSLCKQIENGFRIGENNRKRERERKEALFRL